MLKGPRDGRICGAKGQDSASSPLSWKKNLFYIPEPTLPNSCMPGLPQRKHLQMPLHQSGGKWANAAEQTTAQGFAFVFMALNEPVSLLKGGEMWTACKIWVHWGRAGFPAVTEARGGWTQISSHLDEAALGSHRHQELPSMPEYPGTKS